MLRLDWIGENRRRHPPGLPSRSHATRELVIQALDAAETKADTTKSKPQKG
jgi:hypothetical protein